MSDNLEPTRRVDRLLERATRQSGRLTSTPEYGSWLLGSSGESPRRRRVRIQLLMTAALITSNLVGITAAVLLLTIALAEPSVFRSDAWWIAAVVAPAYILAALAVGTAWVTGRTVKALRWATEGHPATRADQHRTLATPLRVALMNLVLWLIGTALLTLLYGLHDPRYIPNVGFVMLFCGIVVSAACYLFTEFALRPIAARALQAGRPPGRLPSGVTGRIMSTWLFTTAIPVAGTMVTALFTIMIHQLTATQLSVTVLFIGAFALTFGFLLMWVASWLISTPVRVVRQGMARVEEGDLTPTLQVFDGTELGELQRGFNAMVAGLRERERVRDLFGRHVGRDVAAAAEAQDVELGGEERFAAALFIDIIGSTTMVSNRPPTEIVDLLNQFFAIVVDEVNGHRGFVNKFEGDGCLAVFGTPNQLDCPADAALAASRSIAARIRTELPGVDAGIGVAAGIVVAGNVGAHERFEFTVIGPPVNTAARLCELAKSTPAKLLAAADTVCSAGAAEQEHWSFGDAVTLRGQHHETLLALPRDGDGR
ncbi:MAG: adenylate/guanylate cyclase domain-containing protein [Mycolicibacterium insubricum]